MECVEGSHWVDKIIDEIGAALSKVDESIQKGIELWTELTKDIFEDQPTQDLAGHANNGESGEDRSSQETLVQVEERPLLHWSMHIDGLKEKPSEHWALRASKFPECLIQEQEGDDAEGDSYSDSDSDDDIDSDDHSNDDDDSDDHDDDDGGDDDDDDDDDDYSEEDETTGSEEESGSSLKWKGGYELLKNADTSSVENNESCDDDDDDDDKNVVTESSENIWKDCMEAWLDSFTEEDSDLDLKLNNVVMYSEEDNLGASATSSIPSSYHHHNEDDSAGSSLKWNGGYQLLENVDTSSEENDDEVEECYSGSVEQVPEVLRKHRMSDLSNESFVCLDDEDDVSDEGLSPEGDWVYVTRDQVF